MGKRIPFAGLLFFLLRHLVFSFVGVFGSCAKLIFSQLRGFFENSIPERVVSLGMMARVEQLYWCRLVILFDVVGD